MNEFKPKELDLCKRTQELLRNFDGNYTVDFFFDSAWVFAIPKCRWLKKMPTQTIDRENWGIAPKDIRICKAYYSEGVKFKTVKDDYSVRSVARHLHNCAKRQQYKVRSIGDILERVRFEEWDKGRVTFEMEIPIRCFRDFLRKFLKTISPEP